MKSWGMIMAFGLTGYCATAQFAGNAIQERIGTLETFSKRQSTVWSVVANPASLAGAKEFMVGIASERRFLLKELSDHLFGLCLPAGPGGFGLKASYAGSLYEHELAAGLGYGRTIASWMTAGVQFDYYSISISGYGASAVPGCEAGMILQLTDKLRSGVHVSRPLIRSFGHTKEEQWASSYVFGLGYEPSDLFYLGCSIRKQEREPLDIEAGITYKPVPALRIAIGLFTVTSTFYLGIEWKSSVCTIGLFSSWHPQLGITPSISLQYHKPKSEKKNSNQLNL